MANYQQDVRDVAGGDKPLAVYEHNKAPGDAAAADRLATELRLLTLVHDGIGECGRRSKFTAAAADMVTLRQYQRLLEERDNIPRFKFQIQLGQLLGYDRKSIRTFVRHTKESRTCRCTLCGRPESGATVYPS